MKAYFGRIDLPGSGGVPLRRSVALFPAGRADTASTRLRLLPLLSCLDGGTAAELNSLDEILERKPQVLWVQKKLTPELVAAARESKAGGCHILYDCDDSGPALRYWAAPRLVLEMMNIADTILTDTPERALWARCTLTRSSISVVENQVDYGPPGGPTGENEFRHREDGPLRVFWYGYASNLQSLSGFSRVLNDPDGIQMVFCGVEPGVIRRFLPGVAFEHHEWSFSGLPKFLKSCDISLLSHFGSRHDARKSAHKMITSICHGVPALVSKTPDQVRVARAFSIPEALFRDGESLAAGLDMMRSVDHRREYLGKSQQAMMARYGEGSFALAAMKVLAADIESLSTGKTRLRMEAGAASLRNLGFCCYDWLAWRHIA